MVSKITWNNFQKLASAYWKDQVVLFDHLMGDVDLKSIFQHYYNADDLVWDRHYQWTNFLRRSWRRYNQFWERYNDG